MNTFQLLKFKQSAVAVAVGSALIVADTSQAAVFNVSTLEQLRTAIVQANGNDEADTIELTADILGVTEDDPDQGGNLTRFVTSEITINGNGHTISRDEGNAEADDFRFTAVTGSGQLQLTNLTFSGGYLEGFLGGALYVGPSASLSLDSVNLERNGVSSFTVIVRGGAIYSKGELNISNSTISNNSSNSEGGGISVRLYGSSLTMTNSTVSGNSSTRGAGLNVGVFAQATINSSTFSENRESSSFNRSSGGAISVYNDAVLTVRDSTFNNNSANYGGALHLNARGSATVYTSNITSNYAEDHGGAVFVNDAGSQISLIDTQITANEAASDGGGIYSKGTVTLTNSNVSGSSSQASAAGIFNASATGKLVITNSSITANSASGNGGGIRSMGVTEIANSTISDNYASDNGGGISMEAGSSLDMLHTTLSGNLSIYGSGGGLYADQSSTQLRGNIVSGNHAPVGVELAVSAPASFATTTPNVFGESSTTLADAIIGFVPDASTQRIASLDGNTPTALNKLLRPLSKSNCETPIGRPGTAACPNVNLLAERSPAIDATDDCSSLSGVDGLDQTGEPRDATCDAGSMEFVDDETCFVASTANGRVVSFCL